jgi:hypothetical protein
MMKKRRGSPESSDMTLNRILEALYDAQGLLREELASVMLDGSSYLEIQGLTAALCDTDKVITDLLDCNLPGA